MYRQKLWLKLKPGATQSFLVPGMTPGVVTAAGPNWIKVSFRKGGADVPFVADPNQYDSRYYIASEVEGGKSFKRVTEVLEGFLSTRVLRLHLVSGADAMLLVDWDSWEKVAATRKVTGGRVGTNSLLCQVSHSDYRAKSRRKF